MAKTDKDFMQGIPVGFSRVDKAVEEISDHLGVEIAVISGDTDTYAQLEKLITMAKEQKLTHAEEKLRDARNRKVARDMQQQGFIVLSEKARQKMGNINGRGAGSKLDHQPGKD